MIPSSFDYKRATTVSEAITLMQANPNAKILAGGHSLIPAMKLRLSNPSVLIDIARISDLNFIRDRGKYIAIGAMTTHATIASHKTITQKVPLLSHAADLIGDVQIRNKGTIGGSIAHADPASDWPAVLLAADASVVIQGPNGERKVSAEDFFVGFFATAVGENELITEIHVPDPTSSETAGAHLIAYEKFMQPASRFAVVGCAVNLVWQDNIIKRAKVAFNGVSDHAYRAKSVEAALEGKPLDAITIGLAAKHATAEADMIMSDHFASEDYRKHIAEVYCRKALEYCMNS
jgi:aerobic carbon-monoxide dehydrogenase medium subunit